MPNKKAKQKDLLTRALHLELVKPVAVIDRGKETPVSWDEIGPIMHALRRVTSTLINGVTVECAVVDRVNRSYPAGDPRRRNTQSAAYQAVPAELDECRTWAKRKLDEIQGPQTERIAERDKKQGALATISPSSTTRREKLLDEITRLDATIKKVEYDIARYAQQANLQLPSGLQRGIANTSDGYLQRWKKNRRGRIPSAQRGVPIPVPASECSLQLDDKGRLTLDLKLESKGRVRFAVIVGPGQQWAIARAMARGELRHGALNLLYHQQKRKWFAKLPYSVPRPKPPEHCDPNETLVLHRGWDNFLYAVSTTGHTASFRGHHLIAQKRKLRARRTDVKSIARFERGTAAKGHGRGRYYSLPDHLEDREANIMRTTCQQTAARVAQLVMTWGIGRVAIEKYNGMPESDTRYVRQNLPHPPYSQLKAAIEHAILKLGITLEEYDCYYISQTCPLCRNTDARQADHHTGMFRCIGCARYERPLDFVACYHALVSVHGSPGRVWEQRHQSMERAAKDLNHEGSGTKDEPETARKASKRNPRKDPSRPSAIRSRTHAVLASVVASGK